MEVIEERCISQPTLAQEQSGHSASSIATNSRDTLLQLDTDLFHQDEEEAKEEDEFNLPSAVHFAMNREDTMKRISSIEILMRNEPVKEGKVEENDEFIQQKLTKNIKRRLVIEEIINTERGYVNDLSNLVINFFDELSGVSWLAADKKQLLIRNAHQILKFQRIFLYTLEKTILMAVEKDGQKGERRSVPSNPQEQEKKRKSRLLKSQPNISQSSLSTEQSKKVLEEIKNESRGQDKKEGKTSFWKPRFLLKKKKKEKLKKDEDKSLSMLQIATVTDSAPLELPSNLDNFPDIGYCFLDMGAKFEVYVPYCSKQPAAQLLMDELKEKQIMQHFLEVPLCLIIKECGRRMKSRLDIAGFMIKPVQRICKYPLLLQELMKYTPLEEQLERAQLETALERIKVLVSKIDNQKHEYEMEHKTGQFFSRLQNYSGPNNRTLGNILIASKVQAVEIERQENIGSTKIPSKKTLAAFLFSTKLFLVKGKKREWDVRHLLDLDKYTVCKLEGVQKKQLEFSFLLAERHEEELIGKILEIGVESTQQRDKWIEIMEAKCKAQSPIQQEAVKEEYNRRLNVEKKASQFLEGWRIRRPTVEGIPSQSAKKQVTDSNAVKAKSEWTLLRPKKVAASNEKINEAQDSTFSRLQRTLSVFSKSKEKEKVVFSVPSANASNGIFRSKTIYTSNKSAAQSDEIKKLTQSRTSVNLLNIFQRKETAEQKEVEAIAERKEVETTKEMTEQKEVEVTTEMLEQKEVDETEEAESNNEEQMGEQKKDQNGNKKEEQIQVQNEKEEIKEEQC